VNRFVALFVALVAGVGVAVWYYRVPNTGAGGGGVPIVRNDDRWLDDLQSRTPREVEAATEQLEQRGTAALPLIRRTLQDPAATPARRKAALKAAAILGPRATEAMPDVAAALEDPEFSPEAALALSFMGSAAVPSLRDALDSDEAVVRREALRSLGKLRERASIDPQIVIPILLTGLDDVDVQVRTVAATYLGIVRDDPDKAVRGLIKALSDEEAEVRQTAAVALAAYGPLAERAIPALKKAANDPDEDVRREAGRALVTLAEAKQKG
jgi:HEAT repeat protein